MVDFIKNIGLVEILVIAVILVVLFGGKKFKELSRGLGESTKEAKKVKDETTGLIKENIGKGKKKNQDKES